MKGMGRGGFYPEYHCTRTSNAFNPREGRYHPLTEHFLRFQKLLRRRKSGRERKRRREGEEGEEEEKEGRKEAGREGGKEEGKLWSSLKGC